MIEKLNVKSFSKNSRLDTSAKSIDSYQPAQGVRADMNRYSLSLVNTCTVHGHCPRTVQPDDSISCKRKWIFIDQNRVMRCIMDCGESIITPFLEEHDSVIDKN